PVNGPRLNNAAKPEPPPVASAGCASSGVWPWSCSRAITSSTLAASIWPCSSSPASLTALYWNWLTLLTSSPLWGEDRGEGSLLPRACFEHASAQAPNPLPEGKREQKPQPSCVTRNTSSSVVTPASDLAMPSS